MSISDEILFYGGCALAGVSGIALLISLCFLKIKAVKLDAKLDEEYGKSEDLSDSRKQNPEVPAVSKCLFRRDDRPG